MRSIPYFAVLLTLSLSPYARGDYWLAFGDPNTGQPFSGNALTAGTGETVTLAILLWTDEPNQTFTNCDIELDQSDAALIGSDTNPMIQNFDDPPFVNFLFKAPSLLSGFSQGQDLDASVRLELVTIDLLLPSSPGDYLLTVDDSGVAQPTTNINGQNVGAGLQVRDLSISIPEPAALALLAFGSTLLIRRRQRR